MDRDDSRQSPDLFDDDEGVRFGRHEHRQLQQSLPRFSGFRVDVHAANVDAVTGQHAGHRCDQHVAVPDRTTMIDLLNEVRYFLPHLLALSTSSPFWMGRDTGLKSYRTTIFRRFPRTGVPDFFESWSDYENYVQLLVEHGKPLLFGTRGESLVFGLPGNPVSAFVCFELFVRPALRKLAGHPDPGPVVATLPLAEPVAEVNDRPTYRPAKLEMGEAGWSVRPLPWAGAPDLRGLQPADALLVLPAGDARMDRGQPAQVVML